MKEFVNKHPRLYWSVVVALAVLAFAIVTCVGFGKLEKAEAAENVICMYSPNETKEYLVYDIREVDWSQWIASSQSSRYLNPESLADKIIEECSYMVVRPYSTYGLEYYFYKTPVYYASSSISGQASLAFCLKTDYCVRINYGDGSPYVLDVRGCYDDKVDSSTSWYVFHTNGNKSSVIGSTYDFLEGIVDTETAYITRNNLTYPKTEIRSYDGSLPYVVFDSFANDNHVLKDFDSDIEDSEIVVNYQFSDKAFAPENVCRLESVFYVWLPSKSYIADFYSKYFGTTMTYSQEDIASAVLAWQKKVGTDASSVLYKMTRVLELPAGYNFAGSPRYKFDYKDIRDILEYQYGDGETDFDFEEYYGLASLVWNDYMKSITFGHMYMTRVDTVLYEARPDGDYYNGVSTYTMLLNGTGVFSRVSGDALSDENLEDVIDREANDALKDLVGDLGNDVNDLQNQLNNINGTLGSFDVEFDGNSLWGAIRSVGAGIIGMCSFLVSFAGVIGSFFVFLPYDMQEIIGYLVIVGVVVVLWRLLKK